MSKNKNRSRDFPVFTPFTPEEEILSEVLDESIEEVPVIEPLTTVASEPEIEKLTPVARQLVEETAVIAAGARCPSCDLLYPTKEAGNYIKCINCSHNVNLK